MRLLYFLWIIVSGFVVGLIARAIIPGTQPMGFIETTVLGILGSFVGGYLGSLFFKPPLGATFHRAGCLGSVIGAIILIILWRVIGL